MSLNTREPVNPSFARWLLPALLGAIVLVAGAAATRRWLPPVASAHGAGIDRMITYLLVTTGALFILGHLALGYLVWRFGRQPRASFHLPTARAERLWSLIPVILLALIAEGGVFALGLPVWGKLYASSAPPDAVTVEITGEQFGWNFRYPGPDGRFGRTDPALIGPDNHLGIDRRDEAAKDDVWLFGELGLPAGVPVRLRLRSRDTLHSFFLPHQRIKQDAVPGMTIEIWFTPTTPGTYEIACAELCGLGHFQMRGVLTVMPPDEFGRWLDEQPTVEEAGS